MIVILLLAHMFQLKGKVSIYTFSFMLPTHAQTDKRRRQLWCELCWLTTANVYTACTINWLFDSLAFANGKKKQRQAKVLN